MARENICSSFIQTRWCVGIGSSSPDTVSPLKRTMKLRCPLGIQSSKSLLKLLHLISNEQKNPDPELYRYSGCSPLASSLSNTLCWRVQVQRRSTLLHSHPEGCNEQHGKCD